MHTVISETDRDLEHDCSKSTAKGLEKDIGMREEGSVIKAGSEGFASEGVRERGQ